MALLTTIINLLLATQALSLTLSPRQSPSCPPADQCGAACCDVANQYLCMDASKSLCCNALEHDADGICCPQGWPNVGGECCDGQACGSACCNTGAQYLCMDASISLCCNALEEASDGICCPKGQTNVGGACCTGQACGTACCDTAHQFVCASAVSSLCCSALQYDAGGICCPKDAYNAGGKCCWNGEVLCDGECCAGECRLTFGGGGRPTRFRPVCVVNQTACREAGYETCAVQSDCSAPAAGQAVSCENGCCIYSES
jgi:hypothetical protein